MDQRVASQYGDEAGNGHRGEGDDDAVGEVLKHVRVTMMLLAKFCSTFGIFANT
jgi:hypothetical protein